MKTSLIFAILNLSVGISWSYELHEWGTFTTVSGSEGTLLSGLQREEEALPPFVHSHLGMENGGSPDRSELANLINRYGSVWPIDPLDIATDKGLNNRPVAGVTVKMETPVIYFHSKNAFRAKIKVGFEGGTISQWYPARSGGESLPMPPVPANPKLNPVSLDQWRIDFSKGYRGNIAWEIDVLSPEESAKTMTFKPKDSIGWMRARVPEANVVRNGKETENYLFYRGIGNFDPGLKVTVDRDETLTIRNHTGGQIPYLLVYENNTGMPTWKALDHGLADGGQHQVALKELAHQPDQIRTMENPDWWTTVADHGTWDAEIYASLKAGLTRTGLFASEADAMIQTWWHSYFEAKGTRIFWILPESKVDTILPLNVEPAPEKIVRVIVGRSEILRPTKENKWLATSVAPGSIQDEWKSFVATDRFGLAIEERVNALKTEKPQASLDRPDVAAPSHAAATSAK